jgi:hypothetical protein
VVAVLLIGAPVVVALLVAASMRLPSLVSTLLAAYLVFVADLGLATWALSPIRGVSRTGLGVVEGVLLGGALAAWWLRGRPGLPLRQALPAARAVVSEPVTALVLAAIVVLLTYELVVAVTAPANDWDSLTYHLSRVAAWIQHGGIYRIPDAPTPRMNEYQPFAEQEILYLFVAGSSALYAVPQYLAQLAILLAIYGASRRLGFHPRAAACSALLFATFSLVALETTQAQNDLVAASFPVVAACLLLGRGQLEAALAGVAVGIGLGVKLTTALVVPVLFVLAIGQGRKRTLAAMAGAVAAFVGVGMWGYVINLANTGHLLGYLGTHIDTPSWEQPAQPSSLATGVDVLYETLDPSVLSDRFIHLLWIAGAIAAILAGFYALRRARTPRAVVFGALVAVPFLSPVLMMHAGDLVAWFARERGFPVRGPGGNIGSLNRVVTGSTFGPVGTAVFLGIPLVTLAAFLRRRADWRQLALAAAVPLFYVLLAQETFNYFMTRFLVVPAVLVSPLFARLFFSRIAIGAYFVVALIVVGMIVLQNPLRPFDGRYGFGRPWQLSQAQAVFLTDEKGVGAATAAYDRLVPRRACVGAVLGSNEPAYLLSGPKLEHRVVYLPVNDAIVRAYKNLLSYVVISTGPDKWAARQFRRQGWTIRSLGGYWLLAVAPHAADGICTRA